jgi:endonuclease-3
VLRVSNRIGIAKGDDPEVVEQQLCAALPLEGRRKVPADGRSPAAPPGNPWTKASDTLILHGRRICKPKPLCDKCAVRDDCLYYLKVVSKGRKPQGTAAGTAAGRAARREK